MKSASKSRPDVRRAAARSHVINVEMPVEVHERLSALAGKHHRSVRGHVLFLIEKAVKEAA